MAKYVAYVAIIEANRQANKELFGRARDIGATQSHKEAHKRLDSDKKEAPRSVSIKKAR